MLSLKSISRLTCIQALLDLTEDTSQEKTDYIVKLLRTECFTAVSDGLLETLVEMYPLKLTDQLLTILTGVHTRKLCVRKCENLTPVGIVKTLMRCHNVQYLDISEANRYFSIGKKMAPQLTVLQLEGCAMNDDNVHSLLLNLPNLSHLNISSCIGLTDKVFLVDRAVQLSKELNSQYLSQNLPSHSSKLHSVDISGCRQLTSTSVRHLMTWCGSTLRSLNIACTKVDCFALLYLAGYSLHSVIKIALKYDSQKTYSTETLFQQIDDLYQSNPHSENLQSIDSGSDSSTNESTEQSKPLELSQNGKIINDCDNHLTSERTNVIDIEHIPLYDVAVTCSDEMNTVSGNCDQNNQNIEVPLDQSVDTNGDSGVIQGCTFCNDLKKNILECNSDRLRELTNVDKKSEDIKINGKTDSFCDRNECKDLCSKENLNSCIDVPSPSYVCDIHTTNGSHTKLICDNQGFSVESSKNVGIKISSSVSHPLESVHSSCTSSDSDSSQPCNQSLWNGSKSEEINNSRTTDSPVHDNNSSLEFVKIIEPNIISLDIIDAKYYLADLGNECLREFFSVNQNLRKFNMSWKELDDSMLFYVAEHAPDLREAVFEDCSALTSWSIINLAAKCKLLSKLELKGVCFVGDAAIMPLLELKNLKCLNLAEVEITDLTLEKIKESSLMLEELDLSWCEELTNRGINTLATCLPCIQQLSLRHCPVDDITLGLLSENSRNITKLILPSVDSLTDESVTVLAEHLPLLEEIDISWNSALSDKCVSALLKNGSRLKEAYLTGVKRLTSAPFLPLISELSKWRKCQALLRFKYHERKVLHDSDDGDENTYSSDEEYDSLFLPHRSTSYAPNLKILELAYCDHLNDHHLAEIVAVCRGSLMIWDYYCEIVKPAYVKCQGSKGYLAPR